MVDRVKLALTSAGLLLDSGQAARRQPVLVELLGIARYAAFEEILTALRSQLGATRIETLGFARERQIFSVEGPFGPEQLAVVRGNWKRISHRASQERQLFQLRDDPHERDPADDAQMAEELDRLLDAYASRPSRPSGGRVPELSEEELRALQDLGYLREASGP